MSKRKAYVSMPRHNGERFAKLMVGEFERMNAMLDNVGKSRWFELFGTPERAARTLENGTPLCGWCNLQTCERNGGECTLLDYDALLEWLGGASE